MKSTSIIPFPTPEKERHSKTIHSVDLYVGSRLRLRRRILRMSQQTLGKEIGVTFQQIQKYEKGINRVGSSRLYAFSKMLSVPIAFFFDGYEEQNQNIGNTASNILASKETLSLVRFYLQLRDERLRKAFLNLLKVTTNGEGDE